MRSTQGGYESSDRTVDDLRNPPARHATAQQRLAAVEEKCSRAEAEARHVVDDEVYVSVGLIRNVLNGLSDLMTASSHPSGDLEALHVSIAKAVAEVLDGRCQNCLRVRATRHDWDTTAEGERPDLCWEVEGACGWSSDATLGDVVAAALLAGPVGAALAQARAEALRDAAQDWDYPPFADGCARTPRTGASVNKWLRDRADREDPTNG